MDEPPGPHVGKRMVGQFLYLGKRYSDLLAFLILGGCLFGCLVSVEEIWLDEAHTVWISQKPLGALIQASQADNKPPLYHLLMHFWIGIWGISLFALRSFSLLCFLGSAVLLYILGKQWSTTYVARGSTFLFVITPLALYYGREARNYAPLIFLVLASILLCHVALRRTRRLWYVLYTLATLACYYTHYLGLLVAPIHLIQVSWVRESGAWRAWLACQIGSILLYLPWCSYLFAHLSELEGASKWLVPFWKNYPPSMALIRSMQAFMPGGATPSFVGMQTPLILQPILPVLYAFLLIVLLVPFRVAALFPLERKPLIWGGSYLLLPLLIAFLVSFYSPMYMVGRSDVMVLPAFCFLTSLSISRFRSHWVRWTLWGMIAVMAGVSLWHAHANPRRHHERAAWEEISRQLAPGDIIVCTDFTRPTAEYYVQSFLGDNRIIFLSYPGRLAATPATWDREAASMDRKALEYEAVHLAETLRVALKRGNRVLLLYVHLPATRPLFNRLQQEFRLHQDPQGAGLIELNQLGVKVNVLWLKKR